MKIFKSQALCNYLLFVGFSVLMTAGQNGFQMNKAFIVGLIFWSLMPLPIVGILSKEVIETEDSYNISYMFGLLKKVFKKAELLSKHSDGTLFVPGNCIVVSNKHIKFKDNNKSCIIYPIGTSKFETLKIRLEKQNREQEMGQP
jgi:hypothetical protein